jgi:hypothetical protein
MILLASSAILAAEPTERELHVHEGIDLDLSTLVD